MSKPLRLITLAAAAVSLVVAAAVFVNGRTRSALQTLETTVKSAQSAATVRNAQICRRDTEAIREMLDGIDDEDLPPSLLETAWRAIGECALTAGQWDSAVEAFSTLATRNPQLSRAHADLARALSRSGRHAEAARSARLSVQLAPDAWQAHRALGVVLGAAGDTTGAIAEVEKARALAPEKERSGATRFLEELRARQSPPEGQPAPSEGAAEATATSTGEPAGPK